MSSRVFLNNLDDFIAPSQACVNPLVSAKLSAAEKSTDTGLKAGKLTLLTDYSMAAYDEPPLKQARPDLIKSKTATSGQQVASVSLNDCLACSGCVTSAEAVLIAEQSNQRFFTLLNQVKLRQRLLVIQLSPNSIASLAAFLELDPIDLFNRITAIFKLHGATYVLDAAAGNDVMLMEARQEFITRLQRGGRSKAWIMPETTTAISSSEVQRYSSTSQPNSSSTKVDLPELGNRVPLLSSHCPGWVCYAEKTAPQAIPFMSTVKSAQQIVGGLMKLFLSRDVSSSSAALNYDDLQQLDSAKVDTAGVAREVVVVSIQPCFDKKLEASRLDFYHSGSELHEVDLVLSTTELWEILCAFAEENQQTAMDVEVKETEKISLDLDNDAVESNLLFMTVPKRFGHVLKYITSITPNDSSVCDSIERLFRSSSEQGQRVLSAAEQNAGSGGVTEYLFRYAAQQLYGLDLWQQSLQYKQGRNQDYTEIDIASYLGENAVTLPPLRFGRAYGFRNIQSLLLKMKRGTCELDLVEIMACPSGCNNGGGQIKNYNQLLQNSAEETAATRPETVAESKERVGKVEKVFHQHLRFAHPDESPLVQLLYGEAVLGQPGSDRARQILHTRYHAVPKLEEIAPLAAKW